MNTLLTRIPTIQENRLRFGFVSDRAPLDSVCISRAPCSLVVDHTHACFIHDALPPAHQHDHVWVFAPRRAWFASASWVRRYLRQAKVLMSLLPSWKTAL